jgi:LuxR family transcriptional regulator, maltose regulon positive regulatory protein
MLGASLWPGEEPCGASCGCSRLSPVPVVCVVAPAGYGKTTLLAQWARDKGSRVGWVSVDQRDNDPAVLLTYITVALDRVEPIGPRVMSGLVGPGAAMVGAVTLR